MKTKPETASDDAKRVVIFVDGQNVFNDARRAFHTPPFYGSQGQINIMRYARLLVERKVHGSPEPRKLTQIRVYRGRPDPRRDAGTYAAHMRQCSVWEKSGVKVVPRPLRYPRDWPKERAEEKGIDVQIAIDMVTMAINRELDVAILATTDTDLRPALEAFAVLPLDPAPEVEVAAWRSSSMSKKLQVAGQRVWVHFIDEPEYRTVRDKTDYNKA